MRLDILPSLGAETPHPPRVSVGISKPVPAMETLADPIFRQQFEQAYDATLITNPRGKILLGNLRAREFLLSEGQQLQSFDMTQIISGADVTLIDSLGETLTHQRFARINAWCRRGGDQDYFPAEIVVHRITVDKTAYLCFFIRDITWRKEAEERLKTVDTAMRAARAGIAMVTPEGRLWYANPAMRTLCGCNEQEYRDKKIMLSAWLADETMAESLLEITKTAGSWCGELRLKGPDGADVVTECQAVANIDPEGEHIGMVLSVSDMTDRLRALNAERQVERTRVMMESLGGVCHHLGQPATVLLTSLEFLARLPEDEKTTRRDLMKHCLEAAESLRVTLRKLNNIHLYQTEEYLKDESAQGQHIVSLPTTDASETAN